MKTQRIATAAGKLRLAPLTVDQVETLLNDDAADQRWTPIVQSLANAGTAIDLAALKQAIDFEEYRALYEAVLTVSGLKQAEAADGPPVDFDYLRSRLVANLGWTFADCARAPFPSVLALFEYWEECPPVAWLVQAFVGYKPPARARRQHGESTTNGDSSFAEKTLFVGMWGGQVKSGDHLPLALQAALARDMKKENGGSSRN
jgi:hypothetical protein